MSFRIKSDRVREWQRWLETYRTRLIAAGVSPSILEEESNWVYFLEHGYFTPEGSAAPIVDIERLSRSQTESLCLLLEQQDRYQGTVTQNRLQFLLKRGPHSKFTAQEPN